MFDMQLFYFFTVQFLQKCFHNTLYQLHFFVLSFVSFSLISHALSDLFCLMCWNALLSFLCKLQVNFSFVVKEFINHSHYKIGKMFGAYSILKLYYIIGIL